MVDFTKRYVLSASEIKMFNPKWGQAMIDDYLLILSDSDTLATDVANNTDNIATNATNIATNATDITSNTTNITTNTTNIGTNASNITANSTNIGTNSTNIGTNSSNFDAHNNSDSQHGVTGNNVGDGDFAELSTGGVVNLAVAVTDAVDSSVSVTSPDASAAPATYSQTQVQEIVTLANETKADLNTLVTDLNNAVTQLNDLLAKSRTAGQLDV